MAFFAFLFLLMANEIVGPKPTTINDSQYEIYWNKPPADIVCLVPQDDFTKEEVKSLAQELIDTSQQEFTAYDGEAGQIEGGFTIQGWIKESSVYQICHNMTNQLYVLIVRNAETLEMRNNFMAELVKAFTNREEIFKEEVNLIVSADSPGASEVPSTPNHRTNEDGDLNGNINGKNHNRFMEDIDSPAPKTPAGSPSSNDSSTLTVTPTSPRSSSFISSFLNTVDSVGRVVTKLKKIISPDSFGSTDEEQTMPSRIPGAPQASLDPLFQEEEKSPTSLSNLSKCTNAHSAMVDYWACKTSSEHGITTAHKQAAI